ncbi:MAG: hypothetical protein IJL66_06275 [Lachnospiraceae bacterium]|nr:hypothetical protein [Lachnospiraceae bacterium]
MDTRKSAAQRRAALQLFGAVNAVLCLIIIAGTVLAVWNTERFGFFFPVVFFCASLLFLISAVRMLRVVGSEKRTLPAVGRLVLGILLLALAVLALITVR